MQNRIIKQIKSAKLFHTRVYISKSLNYLNSPPPQCISSTELLFRNRHTSRRTSPHWHHRAKSSLSSALRLLFILLFLLTDAFLRSFHAWSLTCSSASSSPGRNPEFNNKWMKSFVWWLLMVLQHQDALNWSDMWTKLTFVLLEPAVLSCETM